MVFNDLYSMKQPWSFFLVGGLLLATFSSFESAPIPTSVATDYADSVVVLSGKVFDKAWQLSSEKLATTTVNSRNPTTDRYSIQLFSGRRAEAITWQQQLIDSVGAHAVLLYYDEPNFKVSVGIYPVRIAAEHDLPGWRSLYPQAFVIQTPALPAPR